MRSSSGRSVHRLFRASAVQARFHREPSEKGETAPAEMPAADRRKWRSCKGEAADRPDSCGEQKTEKDPGEDFRQEETGQLLLARRPVSFCCISEKAQVQTQRLIRSKAQQRNAGKKTIQSQSRQEDHGSLSRSKMLDS